MTERPANGADAEPSEPAVVPPAPADRTADRTGVAAADAAAERLAGVEQAPLDEHVEIYEDVHRRLQEGLADLDEQ